MYENVLSVHDVPVEWQALVSLVERDKAVGWNAESVHRTLTAG